MFGIAAAAYMAPPYQLVANGDGRQIKMVGKMETFQKRNIFVYIQLLCGNRDAQYVATTTTTTSADIVGVFISSWQWLSIYRLTLQRNVGYLNYSPETEIVKLMDMVSLLGILIGNVQGWNVSESFFVMAILVAVARHISWDDESICNGICHKLATIPP